MNYVVLSLLCLIAVVGYVQRVGLNSASRPIQQDLQIDTEQFGLLGSLFLIGYAVTQVPAGRLADRWGSKPALIACAALWSALTAGLGYMPNFASAAVLWLAMGMAQAGIFPCAAKAIGAWIPDTQKAMASGLLGSATMLGTAVASTLTVWLLKRLDWTWQSIYMAYGLAGLAWAVVYAMVVPARSGPSTEVSPPMTADDWRRLATSGSMWLISGQQFFRAAAMIFFINWFPKYLHEQRGASEFDAGVLTTWAGIGAMVGGICGGFFSDWFLRRTGWRRASRQGIAVVGLSIAACLVVASYFISDVEAAAAVLTAGAFTAAFGGVSGYTVTIDFGGRRIGTVFAVMNMCGNIGAALSSYAAGALVQRTGNWDLALLMFAAIFFVDAVCWALLNPKGTLFDDVPSIAVAKTDPK
ncbi:MAG: MFS transporter [Gemmataceae bacterium]|nr:MFS transporter [Gemmataceae bacterium]